MVERDKNTIGPGENRVDESSRKYIDENGTNWVQEAYLKRKYMLAGKTIRRRLSMVGTISGRGIKRPVTILYNEPEADILLEPLVVLPIADRDTNQLTDSNEKKWITNAQASTKRPEISYQSIKILLRGLKTIRGRDSQGRERNFYDEEEIEQVISEYIALPVADKKNGFYEREDGKVFASKRAFESRSTGSGLEKSLQNSETVEVRGNGIHKATFFEFDKISRGIDLFLGLPQIDRKTLKYVDCLGYTWQTLPSVASEFGVSPESFRNKVDHVTIMTGRNTSGRKCTLFRREDIIDLLGGFLSLPKEDKALGVLIDKDGSSLITAWSFAKRYGISSYTASICLNDILYRMGRDKVGKETKFYRESEALRNLEDLRLKRENKPVESETISSEEADEMIRRLLKEI